MTRLAVVLVHCRTPELVRPAVEALVEDSRGAALDLEIRLVDNGSEIRDREAWRDLPVRLMAGGGNRGYAAGVNAGIAATSAPFVVAMNPDVVVRPGCLAALVAELDGGAAAAGPLFSWDAAGRILLPPTEERTVAAELRALLARRSRGVAAIARRRWRRHARRHWEARAPIDSTHLSGALLALRRDAWARVGPFDEEYRLYFEETDWLSRVADAGGRCRFVPGARAAHWYAQSSLHDDRAARWFAESELRFRRRRHGRFATGLLRFATPAARLGSKAVSAAPAACSASHAGPPRLAAAALGLGGGGGWVEASPLPHGFPATGERFEAGLEGWALDDEVWRRAGTPALYVRGIDAGGRESATHLVPARGPLGGPE